MKATLNFFSFKFNFLELFKNFVPDFENLYYLLHLSIKESSSENSESKRDCSKDSCKTHEWSLEIELQKQGILRILKEKEMQMEIELHLKKIG